MSEMATAATSDPSLETNAKGGVRSRQVVTLATVVATIAGGWFWAEREYGSVTGLRQRVAGSLVVVANPYISVGVAEVRSARPFTFRVRNCASTPVRLLGMRSSCGCVTTSTLPVVVPPGEWHEVSGSIRATSEGRESRGLELYTDHPSADVVPCAVMIIGRSRSG